MTVTTRVCAGVVLLLAVIYASEARCYSHQCPPMPPMCSCKCSYPTEGSCTEYNYCAEVGNYVLKKYCTGGMVFNPITEQCDSPDNYQCPPAPVTTPDPEKCTDHMSDCKYWVANGDCVCDPILNGDCSWQYYVQNKCPGSCSGCIDGGVDGGNPDVGGQSGLIEGCVIDCTTPQQYWPHPTNCEKFVQCNPFVAQEMPCGGGTRWNQTLLNCYHADFTQCVTGTYQDVDGNPCGGSTTA